MLESNVICSQADEIAKILQMDCKNYKIRGNDVAAVA